VSQVALPVERVRKGIAHHAVECERCLRHASFAAGEAMLAEKIPEGLRKLAAYHSEQAFTWAKRLPPGGAK
jgi:hypothetical protein